MYGFLIPVNQIIFGFESLLWYFVSLFELILFLSKSSAKVMSG